MDLIEKVKNLILLMNDNNLAEVEIEEETTKIRLKKEQFRDLYKRVSSYQT